MTKNSSNKITQEDIIKISKLARIRLTDEEKIKMQQELSSIFDWIDKLSELGDLADVKPMSSVANMSMQLHKDEISDGNIANDVLKNAPTSEYDCFVVPKVVE